MGILIRRMKAGELVHLRQPRGAWRSWTLAAWDRGYPDMARWAVVLRSPGGAPFRILEGRCLEIEPGIGVVPDCRQSKLKLLIESRLQWEVAYRLTDDEEKELHRA